jgi:phosphatidylglycerophosphate synthase
VIEPSRGLPSLAEIQAASRGAGPKGYLLMTLVRPFGPPLAWVALKAGLHPRHVTYASLFLAFTLVIVAAFGGRAGTIWAPALIVGWELIDVTDGTMARAMKIRDNFGGFVDYVAGITLLAFLPLALSIGAQRSPDGSLSLLLSQFVGPLSLPPYLLVACGGAISAISMYLRVINRTLQVRYRDSLSDDSESLPGSGMGKILRTVIRNLETIGGVQALVFAAAAALSWLEATISLYLVFYLLLMPAFALSVYRTFSSRTAYTDC